MTNYSIAQAKDQLSRLVDKMLSGEAVTITRHGKPVAAIVPSPPEPTPMTLEEIDEMFARARQRKPKNGISAVDLLISMRDEER